MDLNTTTNFTSYGDDYFSLFEDQVDDDCYAKTTEEQTEMFYHFEKMVGLWGNICVGIIGLIGNLINVIVLGQKDMRKNCFNQLLIGKLFSMK